MHSPGEIKALIRFTRNTVMATVNSFNCLLTGNRGITPISATFRKYEAPLNRVNMVLRRGKRSRISGIRNCSRFAAVQIMEMVPTKASSAFSSKRKPVQNVPPTRLAMTLDV